MNNFNEELLFAYIVRFGYSQWFSRQQFYDDSKYDFNTLHYIEPDLYTCKRFDYFYCNYPTWYSHLKFTEFFVTNYLLSYSHRL